MTMILYMSQVSEVESEYLCTELLYILIFALN